MDALVPLVAGRECGGCDVCCVALTIKEPTLKKAQGVPCHNLVPGRGCGIYQDRPPTCVDFHCGWRMLRWVREALRPDLSGVLVRLIPQPEGLGAVFTILREDGLAAEGLAESFAAAVGSGMPVYLEVPTRPGYTSGISQVEHVFVDAVLARDRAEVLRLLRLGWESALTLADGSKPIDLS